MAAPAKSPASTEPVLDPQQVALNKLREPFPESVISLLPKQVRKGDQDRGKCTEQNGRKYSVDGRYCGGYHALSTHLDYVGHAALTDRLLQADPTWGWEPMALDQYGLPLFDQNGGLWIRLHVAGVERLGYGDSQGKSGPNAIKEAIGDALRNAGMRFGAAIDLWSKEDLWAARQEQGTEDSPAPDSQTNPPPRAQPDTQRQSDAQAGAQRRPSPPSEQDLDPTVYPTGGPPITGAERDEWWVRVSKITYLGSNDSRTKDSGMRTAYTEARAAGILTLPIGDGEDMTFADFMANAAARLPEEEPAPFDPATQTAESAVGHITSRPDDAPMALTDGWGTEPGEGGAHSR